MYFKANFPDCLDNNDWKYKAEVPLKLKEHVLDLQTSAVYLASSAAVAQ
jgi:hypothetical protein